MKVTSGLVWSWRRVGCIIALSPGTQDVIFVAQVFGLCVAEQYGACLPAADLARLCATCSASRLAAPRFAKAALGRHGLTSGSLALLCQLEQIPERTTVDLKRAGARKVIAGSSL